VPEVAQDRVPVYSLSRPAVWLMFRRTDPPEKCCANGYFFQHHRCFLL